MDVFLDQPTVLLQFSVTNHRSIADRVTLDLFAAPRLRLHPEHLIPTKDGQPPALPLAIVWGANASGKTNLIDALYFCQKFVLSPARLDEHVPVLPFRLDPIYADAPSVFEFVVQLDEGVFRYQFSVSSQGIESESLHRERATQSQLIFSRLKTNWEPGKSIGFDVERAKFVAEGLLVNELFMSAAANKNLAPMQSLYRWFKSIVILTATSVSHDIILKLKQDEEFRAFVIELMREADTGIVNMEVYKELVSAEQTNIEYVKQHLAKQSPMKFSSGAMAFETSRGAGNTADRSNTENHLLRVLLTHSGKTAANFGLEDESQGTQRLYEMSPVLFEAGRTPRLFVIDEIDSSLHPKLVRFFIEYFLLQRKAGAQLLSTTHDASLLDLGLLRRDEIWFADKDALGKTQLASLHEYINRSDVDLDKHYLAGRFNGIPRLRKSRVSSISDHKANS
jgi:uncharacterized protein